MIMSDKFGKYMHHGVEVFVIEEVKGKHREHCLCFSCDKYHPGAPQGNCPIANLIYAVDLSCHVTTPVYECPEFAERTE
jgi:hypothetical protein